MDVENIKDNPYDNIYWLARMLINTDKYGGIGNKINKMNQLSSVILSAISEFNSHMDEVEKVELLKNIVRNVILEGKKDGSKTKYLLELLCDELEKKLLTADDYKVLAFTCEKIMIPINISLSRIPSDDKKFVETVAKELLDTKGENGLATIINLWDKLGTEGCLAAERAEVVREYINLKSYITKNLPNLRDEDEAIIMSAFCQEFERRLGQKRKGRAGSSLESVTTYILNYFKIPTVSAPEHFTTGLEIDRWIKCRDGWIIGISCKRTLRERWKQTYTTDLDLLNRHKIRELWHVITYDKDLSDDKITEMGSHRAVLYLPDNSPIYINASTHIGMKSYVRPITNFINDIKDLI